MKSVRGTVFKFMAVSEQQICVDEKKIVEEDTKGRETERDRKRANSTPM